ncbi:hypothetical protein EJ110_NYTH12154 [Nymphaea thermarum]|nr:hypothetical protein EJ110_NYTH12154 [Nymphaea thermarum]
MKETTGNLSSNGGRRCEMNKIVLSILQFSLGSVMHAKVGGHIIPSISAPVEQERMESVRDWISKNKLASIGSLWAAAVGGSLVYTGMKSSLKPSLRLIHARMHAQALTLAVLSTAAAIHYYEKKHDAVEQEKNVLGSLHGMKKEALGRLVGRSKEEEVDGLKEEEADGLLSERGVRSIEEGRCSGKGEGKRA